MAFRMKTLFTVATSIVALSKVASAGKNGKAIVHNKCDFDVNLWHVSSEKSDSEPTVLKAGSGSYSENYVKCASGGVSLKLSNSSDGTHITQYEYTMDPTTLFYDISNVNCKGTDCPFWKGGMDLQPSNDCPQVQCSPGNLLCKAAYNLFNDDWATHGCGLDTDLTLTLCPGGSSDNSDDSDDSDDSSSGSGYIGSSSSSSATPPPPSSSAEPTSSKEHHHHSQKSSYAAVVAAADVTPTPSSSTAAPSKPSTTLATSTKKAYQPKPKPSPQTTSVPEQVGEGAAAYTVWATAVEYETVHSTVVVTARDTSHEDYHKNKKRDAKRHPHARRHQHQQ